MIWHLLTIAPQRERHAAAEIIRLGHAILLPTETVWARENSTSKKRRRIERPLMPRYLFVGSKSPPWDDLRQVPAITGVISRNGAPRPIEPHVIDAVMRMRGPGLGVPVTARSLVEGQSARITDGPFRDHVVCVEQIGPEYVRGLLTLFKREQTISIPTAHLEPA